jgi:hypothetical protein
VTLTSGVVEAGDHWRHMPTFGALVVRLLRHAVSGAKAPIVIWPSPLQIEGVDGHGSWLRTLGTYCPCVRVVDSPLIHLWRVHSIASE